VLRIQEIFVWIRIRIRGSIPLTKEADSDPDADPAIFVSDLQDINKKNFSYIVLLITFLRYIILQR
jgi:hypothetical protein